MRRNFNATTQGRRGKRGRIGALMVDPKNKWTLSPPVGSVSNRTGADSSASLTRRDLKCLANSKIYYKSFEKTLERKLHIIVNYI